MRIFKQNKLLTLMLAILFSFSFCVSIPIGNLTNATEPQPAYPDTIDITYGSDYTGGPIYITEDKTIELNGVNIQGTDTDPSPITIAAGAKVNIILSGENTLTAKSDKNSAGIYVQHYEIFDKDHSENDVINDATLNIFGKDNKDTGNKLNVTGGYYGAGIGGVGTGHRSPGTPGIINIYSGTILVQGGADSAGIGSGSRASANEINIYGGNITSFAGSSGAGIGSGYGTYGGATNKSGSYTGGIINIVGGTVRAAAGKFKENYNFDNFDIYNLNDCYEDNQFGAGIGGGYGASSGQITIGGKADVIAIGSCGGAGIGSGRGVSKITNYDENCTPVNITIEGNAKVVAAAPDDNRNNKGGGAAIGGGRGFGVCIYQTDSSGKIVLDENENPIPKDPQPSGIGSIAIKDNANVTTVASPYAASIGGSWMVFSIADRDLTDPTLIAKPDTLQIDPTTTISAVSDGFVPAINAPTGENVSTLLALNFNEEEFFNYHNNDVLDNEEIVKFPLKVVANDGNSETAFAINKANSSCYINLPNATTYKLKVNGQIPTEEIYLSNGVEDNSAEFQAGHYGETEYKCNGLTSPIEQETTIANGSELLKIKIKGKEGIFEYGSTFHAIGVTDPDQIAQLNRDLDDEYEKQLERIHHYNIGVTYRNGQAEGEQPLPEYEEFKGGSVTISVQVPEGWDKDELLALYVKADEGNDETFNHRIETIDGIDYIVFETTHFSVFSTFDPDKHVDPVNPVFPHTGDNINALILAILSMFFKSFSSMFMLYCQR